MELLEQLDQGNLPRHIAIIPDGNGRWAKAQGKSRIAGHIEGAARVKEIVMACKKLGIPYLTVWGLSQDNWLRPKREISGLLNLLWRYLRQEGKNLIKDHISLKAIGELEKLPQKPLQLLQKVIADSAHNDQMTLIFAISYSGRRDILQAINKWVRSRRNGNVDENLDEHQFSQYLETAGLPDPDLLIRTSGESRISNFFLWQLAYTELIISPVFWPEFTHSEFYKCLINYQKRERRFGKTSEQCQS